MDATTSPPRIGRAARLRRVVTALAGVALVGTALVAPAAPATATGGTVDPATGGLYDLVAPDGYEFLPRLEDAILREINTYRASLGLNPLGPMHDQGREVARLNSMWMNGTWETSIVSIGHAQRIVAEVSPGRDAQVNTLAGCAAGSGEVVHSHGDSTVDRLTNDSSQEEIDRHARLTVGWWRDSPPHDATLRGSSHKVAFVGAVLRHDRPRYPDQKALVATARFFAQGTSTSCVVPDPTRAPVSPSLGASSGEDWNSAFVSRIGVWGALDYERRPIRAVFTPAPDSGGQSHDLVLNPDERNSVDVKGLPRQAGRWRFTRDGGAEIPAGSYPGIVGVPGAVERMDPNWNGLDNLQRFADLVRIPADIVSPPLEREMNVGSAEVVWRVDPTVTRLIDGQPHVIANWRGSVNLSNWEGSWRTETGTAPIDSTGVTKWYGAPVDLVRVAGGETWVPAQPPACTFRPDNAQHLCRLVYDTTSWQADGWLRDGCDRDDWIRNGDSCTMLPPELHPRPWDLAGCDEDVWRARGGTCTPPPPVDPGLRCDDGQGGTHGGWLWPDGQHRCVSPPLPTTPPLWHPCDNGGCDGPGTTWNNTHPGFAGVSWAGPARRKGRAWVRALNVPTTTTLVTARNGRSSARVKFKGGRWQLRVKTRGMWKVTVTTPGGNRTLRWRVR